MAKVPTMYRKYSLWGSQKNTGTQPKTNNKINYYNIIVLSHS